MSLVSILPGGATLDYWWEALRGESGRLRFMCWKFLEVAAFCGWWPRSPATSRAFAPRLPRYEDARSDNSVPEAAFVVVVVPARVQSRADAVRLEALLAALGKQSSPCHPVVIDDASPCWPALPGVEVIRLARHSGPAAARNRGMDRAQELGAQVVAFTDADCVPATDWIGKFILAFLRNRHAHAISGATWSKDRAWLGRYHERNGTLNGRRLADRDVLLYGPTCNLALCAEMAVAMRFDADFPSAAAEDIEFCCRALRDGWLIDHAGEVVVWHDFGYDTLGYFGQLARFWRQFRKYGQGERLLLAKQPDYPGLFEGSREIALAVPVGSLSDDPKRDPGVAFAPAGNRSAAKLTRVRS